MWIEALPTGRYTFKVELVSREPTGDLRVFLRLVGLFSSFHDDSLWLTLSEAQQVSFAAACGRWPLDPYLGLHGAAVQLAIESYVVETIGFGPTSKSRVVGWSKVQ